MWEEGEPGAAIGQLGCRKKVNEVLLVGSSLNECSVVVVSICMVSAEEVF